MSESCVSKPLALAKNDRSVHYEEIFVRVSSRSFSLYPVTVPFVGLNIADVHFVSKASSLLLSMLIGYCASCRGLRVLVDLLDEDFAEQTDLVVHALNGIGSVFELQGPTPKNDFCRMFIREGLLDPLSSALLNVMASRGESTSDMKHKIIQILVIFCQVSQSDTHVRTSLGTRKIVRRAFGLRGLKSACTNLRGIRTFTSMRAVGTGAFGSHAQGN